MIGGAAVLLYVPAAPSVPPQAPTPRPVAVKTLETVSPSPSTAPSDIAGPARPKPERTFPQFQAMVRALKEERNPRTRAQAARYLGGHAKHCGLEELHLLKTALADDAAPEVRAASAVALGQFGDRAVPARSALRKASKRDREPSVREAAQSALRAIEAARKPG